MVFSFLAWSYTPTLAGVAGPEEVPGRGLSIRRTEGLSPLPVQVFVERPVPGPGHPLPHHLVLPAGLMQWSSSHLDEGTGEGLTLVPGAPPHQVLVGGICRIIMRVSGEHFHISEGLWPSVLHPVDSFTIQPDAVVHLVQGQDSEGTLKDSSPCRHAEPAR